MTDDAKAKSPNVLEEFLRDFGQVWSRVPNKGLFLGLLALWCALFHFLGNSTLGYVSPAEYEAQLQEAA